MKQSHLHWKSYEKILISKPGFTQIADELEIEYQIARAITKARIERNMSQHDLAKVMHTKQSVISRAENAKTLPSLSFLKRLAAALNVSLQIQFKY
jgi:ribosome-binding protein aMBF1 (putative translation factor)